MNEASLPILRTIAEVRGAVERARREGQRVGFVPTMGALHDGHGRLVETARERTDRVIVSVFVNPTQFGPREDYERYPRTLEADRALCARHGASAIFAPSVVEMYPGGMAGTVVEPPGELANVLEGAFRPGHFRGVATVVLKLLQIVGPDEAFFGEKDYQQLLVVRRLVSDLNVPVSIVGVATVREADGLAMSSRNRYLNEEEREQATVLWRALGRAREVVAGGERDAERVRQSLRETIESVPAAVLDYAEVADSESLERLEELSPGRPSVALLAVRLGPARLIDNAALPVAALGPSAEVR